MAVALNSMKVSDSVTDRRLTECKEYAPIIPSEQERQDLSYFNELPSHDLDAITLWLNSFNINSKKNSKSPLLIAIEKENLALVELLIGSGADVNEASFCQSQNVFETPLSTAARINSFQIVNLLVQNGSNLETDDEKIEVKSALQWAATHGNMDMAAFLLLHGADINWAGPFKNTALHDAALNDQDSIILWLLGNGSEIKLNDEGRTALHIAALRGNSTAVKNLLSHNCEIDVKDIYGFYPISLACMKGHYFLIQYLEAQNKQFEDLNSNQLQQASKLGHSEVLKYLLESGADVNAVDSGGEIVSSGKRNSSAISRNLGIVPDSFVNKSQAANMVNRIRLNSSIASYTKTISSSIVESEDSKLLSVEQDNYENTFFEALYANNLAAISSLLNVSYDINFKNYLHKTPLFIAIEKENMSLIELLVSFGSDVNEPSYCPSQCVFEKPLSTAARINSFQIVNLLLQNGAILEIDDHKIEGKTALQWAAFHGNKNMAESLLLHGADINWIGPFMNTALHYAALSDRTSMVLWLLENGSEITINGDGRTALHIAAVRGNFSAVKYLMSYNCNTDIKDSYGFYPFGLACLRGNYSILRYMKENSRQSENLDDGLHRAAELGHLEVLTYLLDNGADIDAINSHGETALAIASRGQEKSSQLLIERGANLNIADSRGYTCLQNAIMREQIDIAVDLLLNGADVNSYSSETDSPLNLSCTISNPVLVKCIIDAGCNFRKEQWFTQKVVENKSQELDYFRSFRLQKETLELRMIWQWIGDKFNMPPTLLESARQALRRKAIETTNGSSSLNILNSLKLPPILRKYVTLDYYKYI